MMAQTNDAIAQEAALNYPLPDEYKWDSGRYWVGIQKNNATWHWWVYTHNASSNEQIGIVQCREKAGTSPITVDMLDNPLDAIPLMAAKLLMGVWE